MARQQKAENTGKSSRRGSSTFYPSRMTQAQMLERLWYVLEGNDGDGMAAQVRAMYETMPNLVTRERCETVRTEMQHNRRNATDTILKVVVILIGVSGWIVSLLALLTK